MKAQNKINSYHIDNNLILQPALSHQFLVLNETAKTIWQTHEHGLSRKEIRAALIQKYGITSEQADSDVSSVFNLLESAGLFDHPVKSVLTAASEDKEISASVTFGYDEQPDTGILVGYSFNGFDFSICYGNHQLKEHTHAFISHLEKAPATDNINAYKYFQDKTLYSVKKNGVVVALEKEEYQAENMLLTEIVTDAYSQIQIDAIIHAAAVGKDGMCILLPAPRGSGKSTLAAALLHVGFTYLGDDYIPLESSTFDALPVPFALSIKENSWRLLSKLYPEIDNLPVFFRLNKAIKYLIPPDAHRLQLLQKTPVRYVIYPEYNPDTPAGLQEIPAVKSFQNIIEAYSWLNPDALCIGRFVNWLQYRKSYSLSYACLDDAVQLTKNLLNT